MRARVLLIICILWIAGVFLYFNTTADGKNESYNFDNDCVEMSDGRYLVSGSGPLSQYIFDIDKFYRINKIYSIADACDDAELDQLVYLDGYVYAIITSQAHIGPRTLDVYDVVKLSEDMHLIGTSGWFNFSQNGNISDVTLDDGVFAFTQISEDGRDVFVYPLSDSVINPESDKDENNVRHIKTLNYSDYFSSETDGIIYFASYKNGKLQKYENISEDRPQMYYNNYAADAYNNKVLSYQQLIFLNRGLFANCVAIMILGIATILALYVMLVRRNRVAYLILTWEVMLGLNAVSMIWINGRNTSSFIAAAVVFFVGSVLGIIILLLQSIDLGLFVAAMNKLAQGRNDIFKPYTVSGDMRGLWNSLFDLKRAIRDNNYRLFCKYESYFAFAPKHIEDILEMDSIVDVKPKSSISSKNALALIGCSNSFGGKTADEIITTIADLQAQDMGSMISCNADLSKIEVAFSKNNRKVSDFGMQIRDALSAKDTLMIVHYADVLYEICGDDRQNILVTRCAEARELFNCMESLEKLHLNLLMTKEAYDNEAEKPLARYIGHVSLSNVQRNIELYEVLDCMSEKERRKKVDNNDTFNQAIRYIEEKEYYLARNAFAKIIQNDPGDEVARQYLFKCENEISLDTNFDVDFGLNR